MENTGVIRQVMGPVIDVEFAHGKLPALYNALKITNKTLSDAEWNLTVEVASHLGNNMVRCIAMDATEGLARGQLVVDTGAPIQSLDGRACRGRIIYVIGVLIA